MVCTRNVCRSPYAAILLQSALSSRTTAEWGVWSAGTGSVAGQRICPLAAERLVEAGLGDQAFAHHSRPLDSADVEAADLVLVASAEHRAEVARLSPRATARTFTLAEAVRLGSVVRMPVGAPRLPDLVHDLQAARPLLASGRMERHGRHRPPSVSTAAIDIVDGHVMSAAEHRATLRRVRDSVEQIAGLLAAAS
ncbi:hypothetical protein [Naasia sp. SYSU D00057]|uniref:arsenate reductase/protein-tyrosine-phosphatase family protein n=1 Tax=Naasia sp. SYSU D00057 TaxID=2817380 RepID=UPI001B318777|nr:hypothetical protein [Naasia sp. SYSU D00057]